jgi:hypothetical protein
MQSATEGVIGSDYRPADRWLAFDSMFDTHHGAVQCRSVTLSSIN